MSMIQAAVRRLLAVYSGLTIRQMNDAIFLMRDFIKKSEIAGDPEETFDLQIQNLRIFEVSEPILDLLQSRKQAVLHKADEIQHSEDFLYYSFAPVIPFSWEALCAQMDRVNWHPYTFDIALLGDMDYSKAAVHPYYIFDIDYGFDTLEQSPAEARTAIGERERSPLNMAETLSLVFHTYILDQYPVYAGGSFFLSGSTVPFLQKNKHKEVEFGHALLDDRIYRIMPSCKERVVFMIP